MVKMPNHVEVSTTEDFGEQLGLILGREFLLFMPSGHNVYGPISECTIEEGCRRVRQRAYHDMVEIAPGWQIRRRRHRDAGTGKDHQARFTDGVQERMQHREDCTLFARKEENRPDPFSLSDVGRTIRVHQ